MDQPTSQLEGTTRQLHGRGPEVAELGDLLTRTRRCGGSVLLAGEPGIGRSALLDHVAAAAQLRGFAVLRAEGVRSERDLPYAGLEPLLGHSARADAPPAARVASDAVAHLARLSATQPLVLLVDDVQWLDSASRTVLAYLARRVAHHRVLLVTAMRTRTAPVEDPVTATSVRWLPRLTREDAVAVLRERRPGLGPEEVRQVLTDADGNPLALVELGAGPRQADPAADECPAAALSPRLQQAFGDVLEGLPATARTALLVAALDPSSRLGDVLLAASIAADRPVRVGDLDPVGRDSAVTLGPAGVRFHHDLIASAVIRAATFAERRRARAALASVLPDGSPRQVWHRSLSGTQRDEALAAAVEDTASPTLARHGAAAAARALGRAAALSEDPQQRARRLLRAIHQALAAGEPALVRGLLDAADDLPPAPGQRDRLSVLREWVDEDPRRGLPTISRLCVLARHADRTGDRAGALDLLLAAARRCSVSAPAEHEREAILQAGGQLARSGLTVRLRATLALCEPVSRGRDVAALLDLGLGPGTDAADLLVLGMAAQAAGDPVRSLRVLSAAEPRLREQGQLGLLAALLPLKLEVAAVVGDWQLADATVEVLERSDGEPEGLGALRVVPAVQSLPSRAVMAALRGDGTAAHALLVRSRRATAGDGVELLHRPARLAQGIVWWAAGQTGDAFERLHLVLTQPGATSHAHDLFDAIPYLVDAGVAVGRGDAARAALATFERLAVTTPAPALHAALRYARARLAPDRLAERCFESALGADLSGWPLMRARTQLAYGTWLRRQRHLSASRAPLLEARATFEAVGATVWVETASRELRASGLKGPGDAGPGGALLSAQESQIARLAADGLSNREIGERLCLSPRTVGSHLYRIFPKLDITSRTQLGSRLA